MTFPLDLILVILIAELYRSVEPVGAGALKEALGALPLWCIHIGGALLVSWVMVWWVEFRAQRRGVDTAYREYRVLRLLYRAGFTIWYGGFLYLAGWSETIYGDWRLLEWWVVDDLLLVLPYLAAVAVWQVSSYRLGKALWGRGWGRREHFVFYQRQEVLPVLAPWLLLRAVSDGVDAFVPRLPWGLSGWLAEIAAGVLFVALLLLFPEWIRFVLDCRRLPDGTLRLRLQELANRARVRVKDFLVWNTGGAHVASAVLVGAAGWTRYCILSDTLIDTLGQREVEAVAAHELAHVRGHHMGMYMLVVLMFLGGVIGIFGVLPADVAADFFFATPVLLALTLLFWRGFFALLSRMAEDEADLVGAGLMGEAGPLVSALLKMAALAGGAGRLRSWRHRPVEERIRNLVLFENDAGVLERYRRRMKRLRLGLAVLAVLVATGGAYLGYPRFREQDAPLERLRAAANADRENPDAWADYGLLLAKRGRHEEAFRVLIAALEADPGMTRVREALAGLPLEPWRLAVAQARVFIRTGRYRDARSALEAAETGAERPETAAMRAYLAAEPGTAEAPNPFFQPDTARRVLATLPAAARDTLPAVLLRLQLLVLDHDYQAVRALIDGLPASLRNEPEVREYHARYAG